MKKALAFCTLLYMLIAAASFGTSCNTPPPKNGDANNTGTNASPPDANNVSRNVDNNRVVDVETAMIFKVDRDVSLRTKGAAAFVRILSGLFRGGDLLRVGEQSTAWVTCSDKSVCPLGPGDYTECCRSACENGIRLYPPEGQVPRVLMKKTELPPSDLQAFETAETRIRTLGANDVATQFLIANLYSSWKLEEANQEVDKLSQKLKNPETQTQLDRLYLPMLHKTGDMYLKMDKKIEAEDKYKKVIELAPRARDSEEEASARVSLGQYYSNNGRKQEAVENLEKSEQLYTKDGNAKKAAEVNRKLITVQKQ